MKTGPEWLHLAKAELGTKEFAGTANNARVVQYYLDAVGRKHADAVPWCAAFVGAMLARAGRKPSGSLLARSYLNWGEKCQPVPGAIAVFARGRPPSGHVAFIESADERSVTVIGGNQSDAVTRAHYPKAKLLGCRWPKGAKK